MPNKVVKAPNFKRLAEKRTNSVLDSVRKLGNLGSDNYHYQQEEVEKIFHTLTVAVQEAKNCFKKNKRKPFVLED